MSMVNQTPQRRLRVVVSAAIAALLLGSSFYGAQAGNNGGYGNGSDRLNGLEIAAIATGAVGGGLVIASIMRGEGDDEDEESSASKSKSAKAGKVEAVRLISGTSQLSAGDATAVEVEARYEGSRTWTKVTDSANISAVGGLTQIDGARNAFGVPYGSKVASGPATIEATFGGLRASTSVTVN